MKLGTSNGAKYQLVKGVLVNGGKLFISIPEDVFDSFMTEDPLSYEEPEKIRLSGDWNLYSDAFKDNFGYRPERE